MRVFLTSPWIPAEWVRAHGHESRGIWFEESFRQTAPALSAGVCAFAENTIHFAEAEGDAAFVFTSACDQLRRGFDAVAWGKQARTFLFNLPTTRAPAAKQMYRSELDRLGQFLVEMGGSAPRREILRDLMTRADDVRRRLCESAPLAAARPFAESVAKYHQEGGFSAPPASPATPTVPLALVGGPFSLADWPLFDAIEGAGGRVTLNAAGTGERGLNPSLGADEDSFAALVNGYFEHMADVFQRPNTPLYSWLKPRLSARGVRGIILWCFTGCDLWRAEAQTLREAFRLPVLLLEANGAAGISPRDLNRLEAFVETLK